MTDLYSDNAVIRAIENNRLAHAYIILGSKGSGKAALAKTAARMLMCPEMCGVCPECIKALSGNHSDIIEISPQKQHIGIDAIRNLTADISERSVSGAKRVAIIHNAESMTPAAQNCLLKTLEAPPAYALFLLLSENAGGLLPTVISRCAIARMLPLGRDAVYQELLLKGIDKNKAYTAARLSNGLLANAAERVENRDYWDMRDRMLNILSALPQSNMIIAAHSLRTDADKIRLMLSVMTELLNDVSYIGAGKKELCAHADKLDTLESLSKFFTLKQIQGMIMVLFETEKRLVSNVNAKTAFDYWFIKTQEVKMIDA